MNLTSLCYTYVHTCKTYWLLRSATTKSRIHTFSWIHSVIIMYSCSLIKDSMFPPTSRTSVRDIHLFCVCIFILTQFSETVTCFTEFCVLRIHNFFPRNFICLFFQGFLRYQIFWLRSTFSDHYVFMFINKRQHVSSHLLLCCKWYSLISFTNVSHF